MFVEGVLVWREVVRRLAGLELVVVVDGKRGERASERTKRCRKTTNKDEVKGEATRQPRGINAAV